MAGNPLEPFLDAQGYLVLDGGLATALEDRGHLLDSALWSGRLLIDDPDAIRDVHRLYLEAGADCVTTASYQASLPGFRAMDVAEGQAVELLRLSSRIAVEARDAFWASEENRAGRLEPLVAASVGPYGAYLADGSEYRGRYGVTREVLDDFHRGRFRLLAASEVDLLACETIPSFLEMEVLLEILDDVPDVWAWFTFSCRDGRHLCDGSGFEDAVRACSGHPRVAGVGVNCTAPRYVEELIGAGRRSSALPLIAYPNSGGVYDARSKTWAGDRSAEVWLEGMSDWLAAGARVVGGCCRIGPATIRGVRQRAASAHARSDLDR